MIDQVRLSYFRQHIDKTVRFGPGVNIVRGNSEAGKSTILEGVCYGWFGAAALSEPLDDILTWGETGKNKIAVQIDFTHQGCKYTCTRSPKGAEVTKNGEVICTGQGDVTKFMEDLFGMPAKTSHLLLVAAQNDIRGILESNDAHSFIEKLANFDEIDEVISLIQSKLSTGATGPAKAALETAEQQLVEIPEPVKPAVIDTSLDSSNIEDKSKQLRTAKEGVVVIEKALEDAKKVNAARALLLAEINNIEHRLSDNKLSLNKLVVDTPDPEVGLQLESMIKIEQDKEQDWLKYLGFTNLTEYPTDFWEGDYNSFAVELARVEKEVNGAKTNASELKEAIVLQQFRVVSETSCKSCGREFENIAEIEAINSLVKSNIEDLSKKLKAQDVLINSNLEDLVTLQSLEVTHAHYKAWVVDHPDLVTVDHNQIPMKLTWTGAPPEPPDQEKLSSYQTKLRLWQEKKLIAESNLERQSELNNLITTSKKLLTLANGKLQNQKVQNVKFWEIGLTEARAHIDILNNEIATLTTKISKVEHEKALAEVEYNNRVKNKAQAQARVSSAKEALKVLSTNNALLKAVRTARVQVTDSVWNLVLKSISGYFNKLRGDGESSTITKEEKGFRCNGKPVTSLSGSTRDILGLAVRSALSTMFLPAAGMQALDEPAAGCDEARSENVLGFIKSAGFEQTILVTHKDSDEAGADFLVEI